MKYQERSPHSSLQDHVKCFWILEREYKPENPNKEVMTDACIELIFNLCDIRTCYRPSASPSVKCQGRSWSACRRNHCFFDPAGPSRSWRLDFMLGAPCRSSPYRPKHPTTWRSHLTANGMIWLTYSNPKFTRMIMMAPSPVLKIS